MVGSLVLAFIHEAITKSEHQQNDGAKAASAPGFEEFMRAESVREGEKVLPLTRAEDAAIAAKHAHAVVYKEP